MSSEQDKEDASLGRSMRWFGRWYGGSLVICLILVCIFGENGPYRDWILGGSLLGGVLIAVWLTRHEKKREAALQSKNDVVE
jgi:hypothetical protein